MGLLQIQIRMLATVSFLKLKGKSFTLRLNNTYEHYLFFGSTSFLTVSRFRPTTYDRVSSARSVTPMDEVIELRANHSLRLCTSPGLHRLHSSQRVFGLAAATSVSLLPPRPARRLPVLPVVARLICGERGGVVLLERWSSFDDMVAAIRRQTSLSRISEVRLGQRCLGVGSEDRVLVLEGAVLEVLEGR